MLRGRRKLADFFAKRKNLRLRQRCPILFSYHLSLAADSEKRLQLLIITPKKSIRMAHDRKRLRRWTLEAIRQDTNWRELQTHIAETPYNMTISVLHTLPPSAAMNWQVITEIVSKAGEALREVLKRKLEGAE